MRAASAAAPRSRTPSQSTGVGRNIALLLVATAFSVAAFEVCVRALIHASPRSYGTLLGRELPPLRVIPVRAAPAIAPTAMTATPTAAAAASAPSETIGWDDLQGVFREDPLLGYAPRERTTSPHGWWTSNNIGARSTVDTTPEIPPGDRRVLVFGESYGNGSRVRQEDAWPTILGRAPGREVVNLAVDGYGMGQALLRFREVTRTIDYDVALLMFAPSADLWRDVNTVRSLAYASWNSYTVMPRFLVDHDGLTLIRGPYAMPSDVYAANPDGSSDVLRRHLLAYDRFYFPTRYETPPVVGDLVLWKIAATLHHAYARGRLLRALRVRHLDLDSEAMAVTRAIFVTMRDEGAARGKRFFLALLPEPNEVDDVRRSAREWDRAIAAMCPGLDCIDLGRALAAAAPEQIDRGHDHSHYGPTVNRLIAAAVARALEDDRP